MGETLLTYAFPYLAYLLEAGLLGFLLARRRSRRLAGLTLYVGFLLGIDGVARAFALHKYGISSPEYALSFWLTDALLQLAAFLLVCSFFRRACIQEAKLWHFVRLLLVFVFILVFGVSLISLSQDYTQLFTRFVIEFEQNLYFTCLVLTTLLYLLLQRLESADEELGLLVCGLGIQFAGPAASFALRYLTPGQAYSESLVKLIMPASFLGMLLTWFYAVARTSKPATAPARAKKVPDLEEVAV
jgi:glucan phosphoethanolaminetransferase (alkaline phosphatase superfamily)